LYSSANFIEVIKSNRMRWAEHAAHGEIGNAFKILVRKLEGNRPY
jgi:hypothetical protein